MSEKNNEELNMPSEEAKGTGAPHQSPAATASPQGEAEGGTAEENSSASSLPPFSAEQSKGEMPKSQDEAKGVDVEEEPPQSAANAPASSPFNSEANESGRGDKEEPPQSATTSQSAPPLASAKVGAENGAAEEAEEGEEAVKMTAGKRALNIVVNVVVTLVLIFVVFMTVSIILSAGKDYTNFFGYTYLGVETDSMDGDKEDSFAVGDLVVVKILDENEKMELQVGDIATFYETTSQGIRIINSHRIISVETKMDGIQYYQTQGDNAPEPDGFLLSSSAVIGKVTGHVGSLGYVVTWLSSQTGFFVCVVIPSFALVIYCVVNLIITVRSRNKASEADKEAEMRKKILEEMGLNEDGTKKE